MRTRFSVRILRMTVVLFCLFGMTTLAHAQATETQPDEPTKQAEPIEKADVSKAEPTQEQLFAQFTESLTGTTMVGTFTIDGDKSSKRREERYKIKRVTKAENGDYWNIFARMKYGKVDVTLPFPVEVKWAGDTPVITVDELKLIGMGDAFDARIVIADGKYAGTWRHGKVGGLMFGRIETTKKAEKQAESKAEKQETETASDNKSNVE